jgi:ATP-dependent DNA helicase RecQ
VTERDLARPLRELFGFEQFRAGQERAVRSLLAGRDVLAILPTGAGKSLIYQLTSQLLPGVTLVVSPLLALMKDQANGLQALGIPVGVVSSAENSSEIEDAIHQAIAGQTKLLYVTPERLENPSFSTVAQTMNVSLVVVDEAHSISEWGQSFRPAYLTLASSVQQLGRRPAMLALTATATPWVREDIVNGLELRSPEVISRGTFRANLFLEVLRVEEEAEDRRVLRSLLTGDEALSGSGIVYVGTTRAARETAEWLTDWGIAAEFYHGQRSKADRDRVQDGFLSGSIRVIAATNAFGMGIDKPDIRFVIHRDVPSSLERYYQEAGRAGRDGSLARCVLIYRPGDLGRAAFLAAGGELTRDEVVSAHAGLAPLTGKSASVAELEAAAGLGRADLLRLITILEEQHVLRRRGRRFEVARDFDPRELPLEREAARRAYDRSRLEMMRSYAELRQCRWRYILNYFGEEPEWDVCGVCDSDTRNDPQAQGPFEVNDRVVHVSMGEGVVQRVTADSITVLFEQNGYRTLDTGLIMEEGLVHRVGQ